MGFYGPNMCLLELYLRSSVEVRVGLFVVATVAIFIVFLFLLGDYRFGKGLKIYTDFHFSGSLSAGAPVKISGVRIGKVTEVRYVGATKNVDPPLYPEPPERAIQVRATVLIDEAYVDAINSNSTFLINQGLFGESYLEFRRADNGAPVVNGAIFRGRDAQSLDSLISTISRTVSDLKLDQIDLKAVGTLLKDGSSLANTMQRILATAEPEVPVLLSNANGAVLSFKELADGGKKLISTNGDLAKTLNNTKQLSGTLAGGGESLMNEAFNALAAIKKLDAILSAIPPEKVGRIIDNADITMNNLQGGSRDLAAVMGKVRSGQSTVGALLMSQELYNDIKELVKDIKRHPWKVLWRK